MLQNNVKIIGQILFTYIIFSFNVQANLILNSGFELGVDGFENWTCSGDAALRDADTVAYGHILRLW